MRLVTFEDREGARMGVLDGNEIIDVSSRNDVPSDVIAVIEQGADGLDRVRIAATSAPRLARSSVRLLAPIPRPRKNLFCVGKNYHEHAREFLSSGFDASAGASAIPDVPIVFTKPPTAVIGPDAEIPGHLDPTSSVDYENELAVIIGRGGRAIPKARAYEHVFGYTIVNDVTARTLQHKHKQWFLGKGIDGFCPMGPCIVTADEIPDVSGMRLVTRVNGEIRQDALVRDLIFDIPTLIETISTGISLEPGDIIATGTPAGVGIGFNPPKFLRKGDVVSLTIDPIGELTNPVS
jgi:2-keto-4-pentenoate hydratase/2-oxohepta-3-ene-1,7-dioic acid hydratase in catechol pathway